MGIISKSKVIHRYFTLRYSPLMSMAGTKPHLVFPGQNSYSNWSLLDSSSWKKGWGEKGTPFPTGAWCTFWQCLPRLGTFHCTFPSGKAIQEYHCPNVHQLQYMQGLAINTDFLFTFSPPTLGGIFPIVPMHDLVLRVSLHGTQKLRSCLGPGNFEFLTKTLL